MKNLVILSFIAALFVISSCKNEKIVNIDDLLQKIDTITPFGAVEKQQSSRIYTFGRFVGGVKKVFLYQYYILGSDTVEIFTTISDEIYDDELGRTFGDEKTSFFLNRKLFRYKEKFSLSDDYQPIGNYAYCEELSLMYNGYDKYNVKNGRTIIDEHVRINPDSATAVQKLVLAKVAEEISNKTMQGSIKSYANFKNEMIRATNGAEKIMGIENHLIKEVRIKKENIIEARKYLIL